MIFGIFMNSLTLSSGAIYRNSVGFKLSQLFLLSVAVSTLLDQKTVYLVTVATANHFPDFRVDKYPMFVVDFNSITNTTQTTARF